MTTDWFSTLTGFPERSWAETQATLSVAGTNLRSLVNNRTVAIGNLESPSVADRRARALAVAHQIPGRLRVSSVVADVSALHRHPAHRHALFQRVLRMVRDVDLDVRIVSYGRVRPEVERVGTEFSGRT
jgi:hypothetical protein